MFAKTRGEPKVGIAFVSNTSTHTNNQAHEGNHYGPSSAARFSSLMSNLGSGSGSSKGSMNSLNGSQYASEDWRGGGAGAGAGDFMHGNSNRRLSSRTSEEDVKDELSDDPPPPPPPKDRFYLAPDAGSGSTRSLVVNTSPGISNQSHQLHTMAHSLANGNIISPMLTSAPPGPSSWRREPSNSSMAHPQEMGVLRNDDASRLPSKKKPSFFNSLTKGKMKSSKTTPMAVLKSFKDRTSVQSSTPSSASESANGHYEVNSNWEAIEPPDDAPDDGISFPWNFQHNVHVDETYTGLPPSWSRSLQDSGFGTSEVTALNTRSSPPPASYNSPGANFITPNAEAFSQLVRVSAANPEGVLRRPTPRTTSLPVMKTARVADGPIMPMLSPQPNLAPSPASATSVGFFNDLESPSDDKSTDDTNKLLGRGVKLAPKRPPPLQQPPPNPTLATIAIASPSPPPSTALLSEDDHDAIVTPQQAVLVMDPATIVESDHSNHSPPGAMATNKPLPSSPGDNKMNSDLKMRITNASGSDDDRDEGTPPPAYRSTGEPSSSSRSKTALSSRTRTSKSRERAAYNPPPSPVPNIPLPPPPPPPQPLLTDEDGAFSFGPEEDDLNDTEHLDLVTDILPSSQLQLERIVTAAPPRLSLHGGGLSLDLTSWSDDILSALPSAGPSPTQSKLNSSSTAASSTSVPTLSVKRASIVWSNSNRKSILQAQIKPRSRLLTSKKTADLLSPASATVSEPSQQHSRLYVASGDKSSRRKLSRGKSVTKFAAGKVQGPDVEGKNVPVSGNGEDEEQGQTTVLLSPPAATPSRREVVPMVGPNEKPQDAQHHVSGKSITRRQSCAAPGAELSTMDHARSPTMPGTPTYDGVIDWDEYEDQSQENTKEKDGDITARGAPNKQFHRLQPQHSPGSAVSSGDSTSSRASSRVELSPALSRVAASAIQSPDLSDHQLPYLSTPATSPAPNNLIELPSSHFSVPTPPTQMTPSFPTASPPSRLSMVPTLASPPADCVSSAPLSVLTPSTEHFSAAPVRYHGWMAQVLAPLADFISDTTDPRLCFDDLIEIAEGDSGSVYAARVITHMSLGLPVGTTRVAIKNVAILPAGSQKLLDVQHELQILKQVAHEHVLTLDALYVDIIEDSLWIRMELMERSLADVVTLVQDGLMVQERMIARFASDVLCALVFLQKQNIAHRDLRSDNLLLNAAGFLKIADFSNAVQVTAANPTCSGIAGVIYWQAPEIRKMPKYNALKVDVWSLGATIWETAEAEPPFADVQDPRQIADLWPTLTHSSSYTKAFHEFLRLCSLPADSRPTPAELVQTAFIRNACGRAVNVHLLAQCAALEEAMISEEVEEDTAN